MLDYLREEVNTDDDLYNFTDEDFDAVESIISILSIVQAVIIVIVSLLWIYPSCFFAHEARTGIMSKETYDREKYCCCGNSSS